MTIKTALQTIMADESALMAKERPFNVMESRLMATSLSRAKTTKLINSWIKQLFAYRNISGLQKRPFWHKGPSSGHANHGVVVRWPIAFSHSAQTYRL